MKLKSVFTASACALLALTAACEKASPAAPTITPGTSAAQASITDATTGVTIGAPQLVSPAANRTFRFQEQPITLTISNGLTTGTDPLTYTFEVATDSGFGSKVVTKDVAENKSGQTTLTLDKLAASKVYFWRARSNAGTVVGPNSASRSFEVGAEPIIQTPVPSNPANGSTASGSVVTLTVNNVGKAGPVGQVFYKFDVSDSASFGRILATSTVTEQAGQTSYTPPSSVVSAAITYFWRVTASDPSNGLTTAPSSVFSFKYQPFQMSQAKIWDNPRDMGSWVEGAHITSIEFTDDAILVDFDRRNGPDRWPDVGFGTGDIQYTLGMCLNIDGEWNCSAVVQFWHGRDLNASGRPDEIAINWFYDSRWGTLLGHQPNWGETVGIFVAAGNQRDLGNTIAYERSNVVLLPYGSNYSIEGGVRSASIRRSSR